MTEIATLIRDLGVPIAAMVALAVVLYKIGTVCGSLLIEAWKSKDTRLSELETRVNTINNGQREALERRLDASIDEHKQTRTTLEKLSGCLDQIGTAFHRFAESRPCLHDSDIAEVEEATPNPDEKTLERIGRKRVRDAKRAESADG